MIKAINSKTVQILREGMIDGLDTARKASRRVQFRSPVVYDKPAIRTGGWVGLGLISIAAVLLGAWLYFRKRKQVADRYTMGEGPGADAEWEGNAVRSGEPVHQPAA